MNEAFYALDRLYVHHRNRTFRCIDQMDAAEATFVSLPRWRLPARRRTRRWLELWRRAGLAHLDELEAAHVQRQAAA